MSRRAKRRNRRNDKASPRQAEKTRSLQVPANLLEVPTELLESLPKETQVAYIQAASFRGPLPPPVLFGQYEEILKGAADRMIQLAEREQLHRQSWEMAILRLQGGDIRRGNGWDLSWVPWELSLRWFVPIWINHILRASR